MNVQPCPIGTVQTVTPSGQTYCAPALAATAPLSGTGFLSAPGPLNIPMGYVLLLGLGLFGALYLTLRPILHSEKNWPRS